MTNTDISNSDDIIDVRDIIARVEELEAERDGLEYQPAENETPEEAAQRAIDEWQADGEGAELVTLEKLLEELCGSGGDEQWRGSWYPVTLIRDSHFESYAQEFADDIGAVKDEAAWPYTCIDWKKAASELQMDYSSCEFDGVSYWYR